jgi:hypothetical protein
MVLPALSAARCDAGITLLFGKLYRLNAFFCVLKRMKRGGVKERGLYLNFNEAKIIFHK